MPSEPLVGDALTSRAPYLQGRVCPRSRFALYPDQVPAAMPLGGGAGMQQGAYLGQLDLGSMAGQQMMLVPVDGGAGGLGAGPVAGQLAALQQQQQWGGGGAGGMMYVPASPGGGGGMRYYALPSPGQAVPGGGGGAGGMMQPQQQQFGASMGHMPGGAMYGGGGARQPVQLMAAVGVDGSVSPYPTMQQPGGGGSGGAGALAGGAAITYAPPMYGSGASMPMAVQQQWAVQQQQHQQPVRGEQVQQQLQALMQVANGAEIVPQPGAADAFLLAPQQQPFAHHAQPQPRSIGGVEAPGYAVLAAAPGGPAGVVPSPQAPACGAGAAAGGGSDAGAAGASSGQQLDELSQQIGGWRIT